MSGVWWSQPFPPEGTVASEGIRKQLGTPSLDPLVVLIRETAQNSWDARSSECGPVEVRYSLEPFGERSEAFRRHLLPPPEGGGFPSDVFQPSGRMLLVSDRGTTGLGGPLRSDIAFDGRAPDFVNFLRNVGEARDRKFGGGTYGFGKGILFRLSSISTILVDTVCEDSGGYQRRLMAASLGPTFVIGKRRYTGRHWWGRMTDGVIDPLLDAEADAVAADLGLRGFGPGQTGTDVYVLEVDVGTDADGGGRSGAEAGRILAGAAAWYLWPKLVQRSGSRPMVVDIEADGHRVQVPDPQKSHRLRPFVRALARLDGGGGEPLVRKSPPLTIGYLAIDTDVFVDPHDEVLRAVEPFEGAAHHCARMRHVELVVDYFEGPPLGPDDGQYGAVFRATTDADEPFAAAEPPTHDTWVSQHLAGRSQWIVNRARRFIAEELGKLVRSELPAAGGSALPLGRLSSALARLVPGSTGDGGTGGGVGAGSSGGSGAGGRSEVFVTVGSPRLEMDEHGPVVVQWVRFRASNESVEAEASAAVSVNGAREQTAPSGSAAPEVLGWLDVDGAFVAGPVLAVAPDANRDWKVVVRPAANTATLVFVRGRS